ncbi:MAG: SDR family oxidoreductase [Kofleriaceae bacterium]|nr:SDR family oxidoreductase [Kofleriaceae bacterium]
MSTSSTARTSSARTAATSSSGRGAGAWVLITGATAGIGRTTALHLARAGYRVIATGRKVHELEALATEARAAGADLDTLSLDVTSASSIAAAASAVDTLTGGAGLDVLVNNAGFGLIGPLVEVDDAGLRRQYDTNVFGLMAVTRAFLPTMMARRRGRVINVSSVGGRMTFPFMGAYNSTKYAVESLSDALRFELRPFGVDVVLIEPGVIRTNFTDTAMGGLDASTSSAYAASLRKADQLRARMEATAVGPEHVARAITRAIRARRPSARYIAPRRTALVLAAKAVTPTRVWDWSMRQFSFLAGKHVHAALAPTPTPARLDQPNPTGA